MIRLRQRRCVRTSILRDCPALTCHCDFLEMTSHHPVKVKTQTFAALLADTDFPLALDSYQRGFVWTPDNLIQLTNDLQEFSAQAAKGLPYYLGAVLLHRDASKGLRFIIDGQQRMTALSLLFHRSTGKLPEGQILSYSAVSARRIKQAIDALRGQASIAQEIIEQLQLTVIEVDSIDLAFTFFDTQNNRGVRLEATDLLKAFHLRAIDHAAGPLHQKNELERQCASRWETLQRQPSVLSPGQDFAPHLFQRFLWRARRWRGKQTPPAVHDALLDEFQNATWTHEVDDRSRVDTVPVYASLHNRFSTALTMSAHGEHTLHGNQLRVSQNAAHLPMALRQPIHRGVGFFLYADKYAALLQMLMNDVDPCDAVRDFRNFYQEVLGNNQEYLREIFLLCTLVYVDQFEYQDLMPFALRLEFLLGAIRLDKKQVRQETAANFIKDAEQNLLDVIAQSYHPKQVLDFLQQRQLSAAASYAEEAVDMGVGVQGRYKQAVLNYFHGQLRATGDSLANKHQWVERLIKTHQGRGRHD